MGGFKRTADSSCYEYSQESLEEQVDAHGYGDHGGGGQPPRPFLRSPEEHKGDGCHEVEQQISHELSPRGGDPEKILYCPGGLMVLNIKNHKHEQLARQDATATGEDVPELVVETLVAISQRCSGLPDLENREADEILGYDEEGGFS